MSIPSAQKTSSIMSGQTGPALAPGWFLSTTSRGTSTSNSKPTNTLRPPACAMLCA